MVVHFWTTTNKSSRGPGECGLFCLPPNANNPAIIWQTDHTPAPSPLSCLLKGKHVVQCLVSGKVKTHTRWGTKSSRGVRHVVTQSVFPRPLRHIPSLHISTWGRGKWLDPSLLSPGKKKNQSVFRSCHMDTPLNTWPLTPAGFSSESVTGICLCCRCLLCVRR